MSRKHKYRARWKDTGKVIPDFMEEYTLDHLNDDCILVEEFTGFLDKNGVEVFESDIVRMIGTGTCISEVNGCDTTDRIVIWSQKNCEFSWKLLDGQVTSSGYCLSEGNQSIAEVIGNIHEHSHLLEITDET